MRRWISVVYLQNFGTDVLSRLMAVSVLALSVSALAKPPFQATVSPITADIKARMVHGNTWRPGCPVGLEDLRYLRLTYLGFDGQAHRGEMIVHRDVADEVAAIFRDLYERGHPIRQMKLASSYGGSDWRSIEADNTSAFNCRRATGSKKWSRHAYGTAIDLNPIENPYVSRNGRIAHRASLRYKKRLRRGTDTAQKAMLLPNDPAVKLFERRGWRWGGRWRGVKDYQHFDKLLSKG